MNNDVILNVKEREIKKIKNKRVLFISAIIIVLIIVVLNFVSFLIT